MARNTSENLLWLTRQKKKQRNGQGRRCCETPGSCGPLASHRADGRNSTWQKKQTSQGKNQSKKKEGGRGYEALLADPRFASTPHRKIKMSNRKG